MIKGMYLQEDAVIIPAQGIVYAQIVESNLAQKWNELSPWKYKEKIIINIPECIKNCPGAAAVHDLQLSVFPQDRFKLLSPPIKVLQFDWSKDKIPNKNCSFKEFTAIQSGRAQMVFMWWELIMDHESKIILSCAPIWNHPLWKGKFRSSHMSDSNKDSLHFSSCIPWRDHWIQAIYYLPVEVNLVVTQSFTIASNHDEYSLWFDVKKTVQDRLDVSNLTMKCEKVNKKPVCECGLHYLLSRTRIGSLNDDHRRNVYLEVLKKNISENTIIVVFGNLSLLSVVAASFGAKRVYTLETNNINKALIQKIVDVNNFKETVLICSTYEDIFKDIVKNFENTDVNVSLIAEPYFSSSILPWDNIRFWYEKNEFLKFLLYKVESKIYDFGNTFIHNMQTIPQRGFIWGLAIEFDNLWKIRSPVRNCEGFNMRKFDSLIANSMKIADSVVEAQPLWEYPGKALTEKVKLFSFDFSKNLPEVMIKNKGTFQVRDSGRCHGIALWMDYEFRDGQCLTFGPVSEVEIKKYVNWDMYERQGLYLFYEREYVNSKKSIEYDICFDPKEAKFNFSFAMKN